MLLEQIIITALLAATIVTLLYMWGIMRKYAVYRKKWMPDADCYFCLSFWTSVVLILVLFPSWWFLPMALAATPISTALLTKLLIE